MKVIPYEQRCVTVFERKPKGSRIVMRRWRCKRKRLNGSYYCSYCEPLHEKEARIKLKGKAP